MKTITIIAKEEEIWEWKGRAVREKKRFGEWVRSRLNVGVGKLENRQIGEAEQKQKGVEVELVETKEPRETRKADTVEGARERVAEMEAKKKAGELKRLKEAGKAMEERYGK